MIEGQSSQRRGRDSLDRCRGQDRQEQSGQGRHVVDQDNEREPHLPHMVGLGRLHDGLQVRPDPEHQFKSDPSLAGHEDELRHRLEEVAQAPFKSAEGDAPASTHEGTSISTGPDPSQISLVSDSSALSPLSLKSSCETQRDETEGPPSPQPHVYTPAPLRFQNPFEPEHTPIYTVHQQPIPPTPPHHHHLSHLIHLSHEPSHFKGLAHLLEHDRYSPEHSQPGSGESTPTGEHHHKAIRPLIHAIMAFEKGRKFSTGTSAHRKRKMSTLVEREGAFGPALTVCHLLSHSGHLPCYHDALGVWTAIDRPPADSWDIDLILGHLSRVL